jgi:DNA-binding response OmpR family regulator
MEKTILILEDEKEIAYLYEKSLRKNGYNPILAFDGLEGLDKLKKIKPDLILLDLAMPNMGGLEFYRYICGIDGKPRYPVVVLTARLDLMEVIKDLAIESVLTKPFEAGRLITEIQSVLGRPGENEKSCAKRIVIIEEDKSFADAIAKMLYEMGYNSEVARSGEEGVEKIEKNPPDLALVNLSLTDLSGDLVILKLQQVIKTRNTKYILYASKTHDHDKNVMEGLAKKTGVRLVCECSKPMELLEVVIKICHGLGPQLA